MAVVLLLVLWARLTPLALSVTGDQAHHLAKRQHRQALMLEHDQIPPSVAAAIDSQVQSWIELNPADYQAKRQSLAQQLQAQYRYADPDHPEHMYLGGRDSYAWLRRARQYLRTGTTCEKWVEGVCYNLYTHAPVGSRAIYHQSIHIAAIVGLHRLMTWFDPAYPLTSSAFLVPVVIGTLGVLPAFSIGFRLAGLMGGVAAGLLTMLHPSLLWRSISSDDDVWHVVLPLGMVWAAVAALTASTRRGQIGYGLLASLLVTVHAGSWSGWAFGYLVLVASLWGHVLFQVVREAVRSRTYRLWRAEEVRRAALVALVVYVGAGLGGMWVGVGASAFTLPFTYLPPLLRAAWAAGETGGQHYLINALSGVEELRRLSLPDMIDVMGGPPLFLSGLLGLLLICLPRPPWRWWHVAVLMGGAIWCVWLLTLDELTFRELGHLMCIPLGAALLLRLGQTEDRAGVAIAMIIALWYIGGTQLTQQKRYLLLLGPPFGLACAGGLGRLYDALIIGGARWTAQKRIWLHVGCWMAVALLLIPSVQHGFAIANRYTPEMHDAWWDTLTELRDESTPDAIINTTWNYGYWVEYVAERRVSQDGASLRTHIPHWMSKALVAPSERESLGILRMLNCGSAATPLPEGDQGAYGKLLRAGRDPLTAYGILNDLIRRDRASAQAYLAQAGFKPDEQAKILSSSHCLPPESYLVLPLDLTRYVTAWTRQGLWDPRRAYIARRVRHMPKPKAIKELQERFGATQSRAKEVYQHVSELRSGRQRLSYIAPRQWLMAREWFPCRREADRLVCPVGEQLPLGDWISAFIMDLKTPRAAYLQVHHWQQNGLFDNPPVKETPGAILIADTQGMRTIGLPSPTYEPLGILVDVPQQRLLIGTTALLRSTYSHLMFLDGRYLKYYEKIKDKSTVDGDRVVTWRLNWPGS